MKFLLVFLIVLLTMVAKSNPQEKNDESDGPSSDTSKKREGRETIKQMDGEFCNRDGGSIILEESKDSPSSLCGGRDINIIEKATVKNSNVGGQGNSITINEKIIYEDRSKLKSSTPWFGLNIEYQNQLLSKSLVILQGDKDNKIGLDSLLGNVSREELSDLIDDYTLYKLQENIEIHLGQKLPGLGETENYFITRSLLELHTGSVDEISLRDAITQMGQYDNIVISDDAGTGKSIVLKAIARVMKEMFPHRWIIFVDLKNYASVFERLLHSQPEKILNPVSFFISEIFQTINQEKGLIDFEKQILHLLLDKNGDVVVLFDGFDEISPKYGKVVKSLIKGLTTRRVENIVVATRPYAAKDLEEALKAVSYSLKPFDQKDRLNFLVKHWSYKSTIQNHSILSTKANRLIEIFSSSIKDSDRQFMGVPLQCILLAEVYKDKLNSSDEWATISLYELYQEFTSMKFQEEENKYRSTISTSGTENNDLTKALLQEYHWESAFQLLFGEDIVGKIKFHHPRKEVKKSLMQKAERVGIMTTVGDDPMFIHRTFSEFLVANFFIESVKNLQEDEFWDAGQILVAHVLTSDGFFVVKSFFENGLIFENIEDDKFRIIQKSILRAWRLDSQFTYQSLSGTFKFAEDQYRHETYRFLLKCLIHHGAMPIELFPLVVAAAPSYRERPYKTSPFTRTFFQFLSNCSKSVQEIIMTDITFRKYYTIVAVIEYYGLKVTQKSILEKRGMFVKFLDYAAAGDVQGLGELLLDANDEITRFWLLNTWISDNKGNYQSALASAVENNRESALQFLLEKGAAVNHPVDQKYGSLLFKAIRSGLVNCAKILLEKHPRDKDGRTVLHISAAQGTPIDIKSLLSLRANIHDTDDEGRTVLHWAAMEGSTETLAALLNFGANINAKDIKGKTALHEAAGRNLYREELLETLLEHGADVHARDKKGRTPLHYAAAHGSHAAVLILLNYGANILDKDEKGNTALHEAAKHSLYREEVLEILLVYAGDNEIRDKEERKALQYGANEALSTLLSLRDNILVKKEKGRSLI